MKTGAKKADRDWGNSKWLETAINDLVRLRQGAELRHSQAVLQRHQYQFEGEGQDQGPIDGEYLAHLVRQQLSAGNIRTAIDELIDRLCEANGNRQCSEP